MSSEKISGVDSLSPLNRERCLTMLKILRDSGKNEVARADYTASGLRAGLAV
jgi:hypothetical protein